MALFRNQLIDVIDWVKEDADDLVYKYERHNNEIKTGARLTVRPGQMAVFICNGKLADVFEEGQHTLSTKNIPILTALLSLPFGFKSFKSDIYFVDISLQLDHKWGTTSPISLRDQDFGIIRIKARGTFAYKISSDNLTVFMKKVLGMGTSNLKASEFAKTLKPFVLSGITDTVAESRVPFLDLATQLDEFSYMITNKMNEKIEKYIVEFSDIIIEAFDVPEAVEEAINQRSSMGALGNMNQYTQYMTAQAIKDAANNGSGVSGMGANLGAGLAMGQTMMNSMNNQNGANNQNQQVIKVKCTTCGTLLDPEAKFCGNCGTKQGPSTCPNCNAQLKQGAKFCGECGTKV